jgi:CHAT domain-containing protein/tetratricopeptide (TPR) repeat protein
LRQADDAARLYERRDARWCWQFQILAARAQIARGQYSDVIVRLKSPLPPELETSDVAILRRMILANAEDATEQFAAAQVDIAEAERLAVAAPPKIVMQVLQTRANMEFSQKKFTQSEATFRRVLDLARQQHLQVAEVAAQGGLGNAAMGQEHFDEAIDRYKASLQLAKIAGTNYSVPETLGNLGWSYDALGDYANAEDYFKRAEQEELKAGQAADRISTLSNLANVYSETHEYGQAESTASQALKLARELRDPHTTVQCLNSLADIALETARLEVAEKYNREATETEAQGFDHGEIVDTTLTSGRIAEKRGDLRRAEEVFKKVSVDSEAPTTSRWNSEARLATVYSEENRFGDAEKEFQLCLQTIREARSTVEREESRLSFLSGAISFYGAYIDFLVSRGRIGEALQVAEASRARTLAEGLGSANQTLPTKFDSTSLGRLSKQLHSTLLCYWMGRERSHLWVITADKVSYFPLADSLQIDEELRNYHEAMVSSSDALDPVNSDGQKLYTALVEPAKKLIAKDARVTILPDGNLYGLNFETLIVPGSQPHYWIEDVSVTTASSLTLLASSARQHAPGTKRLLLIGDAEQASSEFQKLPQAGAEMQLVEQYFAVADREILEGKQATPVAYLAGNPEHFSYLHFVTHGTASLTHPMDSAVILSPQGADNVYKLYARDIVAHRLNATLVTISACNGAGTRAYSGEGLVGLSWAFLRAGAHNVIGALWEVNDRSTPQLMDSLYGGLTKGQDPATALRNAKLAFLHSGTVYSKPFYWAPFQLYAGS